jgi:hypothetical protein
MIQMVADHPAVRLRDLGSLEQILYGGSPISEAVLERASAALPGVAFVQASSMRACARASWESYRTNRDMTVVPEQRRGAKAAVDVPVAERGRHKAFLGEAVEGFVERSFARSRFDRGHRGDRRQPEPCEKAAAVHVRECT